MEGDGLLKETNRRLQELVAELLKKNEGLRQELLMLRQRAGGGAGEQTWKAN